MLSLYKEIRFVLKKNDYVLTSKRLPTEQLLK